jgi:hypothetical protein
MVVEFSKQNMYVAVPYMPLSNQLGDKKPLI